MNKFVDNKIVITSFLVLALIYFPLFSAAVVLFAQQRSNISITQATALPLVNTEGNQVKLIINYSIGDESIVGQRITRLLALNETLPPAASPPLPPPSIADTGGTASDDDSSSNSDDE